MSLVDLKRAQQAALEQYQMYASANTYGKPLEELVQLDLAFAKAKKNYLAATEAYTRALESAL